MGRPPTRSPTGPPPVPHPVPHPGRGRVPPPSPSTLPAYRSRVSRGCVAARASSGADRMAPPAPKAFRTIEAVARSWGELLGEADAAPEPEDERAGLFSRLRDSLSKSRRALTEQIQVAAFDPGDELA